MSLDHICATKISKPRRLKYAITPRYKCGVLPTIDSSQWVRIESGLDDFRQGASTSAAGNLKPLRGVDLPPIFHETYDTSSETMLPSSSILKPSSDASSFSMKGDKGSTIKMVSWPSRERHHRKPIKPIDQVIKDNPLILLPYLERSLPDEVFSRLLKMMSASSTSSVDSKTTPTESGLRLHRDSITQSLHKTDSKILSLSRSAVPSAQRRLTFAGMKARPSGSTFSRPLALQEMVDKLSDVKSSTLSLHSEDYLLQLRDSLVKIAKLDERDGLLSIQELNPYRNFTKRTRLHFKSRRKKGKIVTPPPKPVEERSLFLETAEEFCQWLKTVGGEDEKLTMDPDKVVSLFAMDTDYSSSHTTAFNVLKDTTLPGGVMEASRPSKEDLLQLLQKKRRRKHKKYVQYRYGRWYLDVGDWKKLAPHEKLQDPEAVETRRRRRAQIKSSNVDGELHGLFSCKALRDYTTHYKLPVPHVLRNVRLPAYDKDEPEWEAFESKLSRLTVQSNLSIH